MFFEATAVLMAEIFKLVTCLFLVFNDEGRDSKKYFNSLYQTIWVDKIDTLKVNLFLKKTFLQLLNVTSVLSVTKQNLLIDFDSVSHTTPCMQLETVGEN